MNSNSHWGAAAYFIVIVCNIGFWDHSWIKSNIFVLFTALISGTLLHIQDAGFTSVTIGRYFKQYLMLNWISNFDKKYNILQWQQFVYRQSTSLSSFAVDSCHYCRTISAFISPNNPPRVLTASQFTSNGRKWILGVCAHGRCFCHFPWNDLSLWLCGCMTRVCLCISLCSQTCCLL